VNAPIRVRLTVLYVALLAAIVVALTVFVVTRLRSDLTAELDRGLEESAAQIALAYRAEGAEEFHDTTRTVLPTTGREPAGAQLVDPLGHVLLTEGTPLASASLLPRRALFRVLGGARVVSSRRVGRPQQHLRLIGVPAARRGRREALIVAESLHEIDDSTHRALVLLLLGGGSSLALVAVGGWWIARRALRPVDRMATRADAIGIEDLSQRIAIPRVNDELAHLARTLNAMLERLQDGVQARERLVADASHELRAPLAAMRAELDVTLAQNRLDGPAREALELARDDAVRLTRIVDNLLTLARVDAGRLELLITPHDLSDLADRAVRGQRAAASERGIDLAVDGDAIVAEVDGDRFGQVLTNLLDNAVRNSPQGGRVRVCIRRDIASTHITVADEGPGIPADAREKAFGRFSRHDLARPRGGAGLGLAICKEIVSAHEGHIWIDEHRPRGTTIHITLAAPEAGRAGPGPLVRVS